MRVFIDADGCPVVDIAIACAGRKAIPVTLVCDTAHEMNRAGATTITVDQGAGSADFRLVNLLHSGDLVITQDYGLAAMALARGAQVLNQDGMHYTGDNIDSLLLARHTARKIRMGGGRLKGPAKRTRDQDERFRQVFCEMLAATVD